MHYASFHTCLRLRACRVRKCAPRKAESGVKEGGLPKDIIADSRGPHWSKGPGVAALESRFACLSHTWQITFPRLVGGSCGDNPFD